MIIVYLAGLLAAFLIGIGVGLFIMLRKKRHLVVEHQKVIDKMHRTICSQEESLISSYLLALLKGRKTKFSEREQESGFELSLRSGNVALVGCYVPQKEEKPEKDERDFFVVDNVFSELMEGEIFYRIEDGRYWMDIQ